MSCTEKSIAVYHIGGAAVAGTVVVVPDPEALGSIWRTVTAINDSDQDIKVSFKTSTGYDNSFIVPKSIKGFTKSMSDTIDNTSLRVYSMAAATAATGNITFNLST